MKTFKIHYLGLLITLLSLTACFEQKTPQEVSQAFWQAVISNDINEVVKYSSLNNIQAYDGFSEDLSQTTPSWGRIIIEGNQANIDTVLVNPLNTNVKNKKFKTFLVLQNEQWTVDYAKTKENMHGDVLSNLFGQLSQLGDTLSEQVKSSTDEINRELNDEIERMHQEFNELSNTINLQTTNIIDKYAKILREKINELSASIDRVLREQEKELSDKDKRVLIRVSDDLNKSSENLVEPDMQSIVQGSKSVTKAVYRLETTDNSTIGEYKNQWREWANEFEVEVKKMLSELSASLSSERKNDRDAI